MDKKKVEWLFLDKIGTDFIRECENIVNDETLFKNFKRNAIFCEIIGNDVRDQQISDNLYNKVKSTDIFNDIEKYKTNDKYGSPILYHYSDIGYISPGTLYFMDILNDLINRFGDLRNLNILELGSGYGGQAKIILDYGVNSYTCVDIKEPLSLCKKYLDLFDYKNTKFIDTESIEAEIEKTQYDLIISNWCLSEFNKDGIEYYIETIVKRASCGYFLMNIWDADRKSFLLETMAKHFSNIEVEGENVKTHWGDNFLLIVKK